MDLSFARRNHRSARLDLGSLLASAAAAQAVTNTATTQARAFAPGQDATPKGATLGILLSSWIKPSAAGVPSFNASVAHALMTPRQPL